MGSPQHAVANFAKDEGGGYMARCSCGDVLRAPTTDALATVIGNHVLGLDVPEAGQ